MNARHDAQLRVRALHPPLSEIFATLRGAPAPDPAPAPGPAPVDDAAAAREAARARNAGVIASVREADGWIAVQRFGEPWCPSPGCYGRNGAELGDTPPPFADDCNCSAEAVQVR